MSVGRWFDRLWQQIVAPRVDGEQLEACLQQARQSMGTPVVWLLGKAQSGKTSIVRALTGSDRAQIGNGFEPCTRTAHLYSFPQEDECFVKFLDTRGLGEIAYDPTDDMAMLAGQSHLLLVVVKALDHAQQGVLAPLAEIRRAHPEWPLIVAQTCLHEGYAPGQGHVEPYPFDQAPLPPTVPSDLARSLAAQRAWFDCPPTAFVPLDFTLPDDGYTPEHYGLDALWNAIEVALPIGLRSMLQQGESGRLLRDAYLQAAQPHILFYAVAAGMAAAVPVPLIDIPLVLAIQGKMFHTIASIYGQDWAMSRIAEFASTLGAGYLGRYLVRLTSRDLLKVIPLPGITSAASALFVASSSYALGRALCTYFSHVQAGAAPSTSALRSMLEREFEEGRSRLRQYLERATGRREAAP